MWPLATLLLSSAAAVSFSFFLRLTVARLVGATIEEATLFMGPELFQFTSGRTRFAVALFPIGHSVKLAGMGDEGIKPASEEVDSEEVTRPFDSLPASARLAVLASNPVAFLVLAALCLGLPSAWGSMVRGLSQVLSGALHPLTIGERRIRQLYEILETRPFAAALGILSAKLASFNLLPWPPSDAGRMLLLPLERPLRRFPSVVNTCFLIGTLLCASIAVSWMIALARVQMVR